MDYRIVQIDGLWHAVFANGYKTEGFKNANMARGAASAYIQAVALGGK